MTDTARARGAVVHLVTHTHWDREWYLPAGRFRQRLVALIDELLDDHDVHAPFLLDGQAVVLDDYLAVRPERSLELARRLQAGGLEAGPWYVLADELIPGGEALVRNLLAGRRTLRRLGASAPPVLYSPDAFGHSAALPQLARGFGVPLVIVWRGFGGSRWPPGDTALWEGPDGSRVVLFHLSPSGYELGSNLPADDALARQRWAEIRDQLAARSRTGILLVQNGADHHARQLEHAAAARALEAAAAHVPVERVSLRQFATALVARAGATALPIVHGELRDSYGYAWTLQGTFAARAQQKRRNAHAERLLVHDAEPWCALAARRGAGSRRHLANAAWRALLLSHPHDTLCGCSIDAVARAMDARLDDAIAQAGGLRDDAVLDLIGHDVVAARPLRDEWRPLVLVRNRAARPRGGVAQLELEAFLAHVSVGPGSAAPDDALAGPAALALRGVPLQPLGATRENRRTESPRHYPDNDLVEVRRVAAWLAPMPGYTIAALPLEAHPGLGSPAGHTRVRPTEPRARAEEAVATRADADGRYVPVTASASSLENGIVRVTLRPDRTVALASVDRSWTAERAVALEDVGDRGDLYTHSPYGAVRIEPTFRRARLVHRGPLCGEIATWWRIGLPSAAERRAAGLPPLVRGARSVPVRISLRLEAGAPFVRVLVDGLNVGPDHRLRVRFRTGIATPAVWADAAFGPVERRPIEVPEADMRAERPPRTAPLHRYVSLFDATRGCTVYGDGLAEYEADRAGDVAVTLLRAVGELSRNDLPERPGHAGWPVPTPEAQSPGPFAGELALLPHGARSPTTVDMIERTADDVLLPLVGTTLRSAIRRHPPSGGLELEGEGLAFGAAKESDEGDWLVLRCVNLLDAPVRGTWRLPFDATAAHLARLDETPLAALPLDDRAVAFEAGARAVVTLLVR